MVGPQLSNEKSGGWSELHKNSSSVNLAVPQMAGVSDTEASTDSLPSVSADDLNTSDEETWLFASPRTNGNSTEWLKKDIDDPSITTSRHSLLNKLNEIANTPKQTPNDTPNDTPRHTPYDTPKHTPNDTPRETPDISMSSSPNTSGLVTPDSPPHRGEIDSRTFVRPRRKKSSIPSSGDSYSERDLRLSERDLRLSEKRFSGQYESRKEHFDQRFEAYENVPYESDYRSCRIEGNPHSQTSGIRIQLQQQKGGSVLAMSSGSLGSEDDDHLSSASEGSYCKINDVEDVNTLARLQEESLKVADTSQSRRVQEESKLSNARSKISRLPAPKSGRVSVGSSQEDLLSGYIPRSGLPLHASPRRGGLDGRTGFSPPISPYTSNSSLNATNGGSNGLRLMSNVGFGQESGGYSSSGGSRGGSPARDINSANRRTRLQSPQVRGVVRSDRSKIGGIPRPSSSVTSSPLHRPAQQRPQSGLRVPSGQAGATARAAPRVTPKPGIPAPAIKQPLNDWREGCY